MQYLKFVPVILKWIPHVVSAVALVEVLASGKTGAEKKAAAMAWLERTSEKMNLPWGKQVSSIVSALVDAAVGVANLVGYFKRDEPNAEVVRFPQEKQ
jgi:hypothetical protein